MSKFLQNSTSRFPHYIQFYPEKYENTSISKVKVTTYIYTKSHQFLTGVFFTDFVWRETHRQTDNVNTPLPASQSTAGTSLLAIIS